MCQFKDDNLNLILIFEIQFNFKWVWNFLTWQLNKDMLLMNNYSVCKLTRH